MTSCQVVPNARFKHFWSTQPNACGIQPGSCSTDPCGEPGLKLIDVPDPCAAVVGCYTNCPPTKLLGRTIATNDYIRGLALNILGTNAEAPATECGQIPGQRGGYWADNYRSDGIKSGTSIRSAKYMGTIAQQIALAQAYATADMQKLVTYGVAISVTCKVTYAGNNTLNLVINIYGNDGVTSNINFTGKRLANSFVWAN